jgi:NRAMP (natural resistance-associated macrophage protein)-like metal ion transporter
MACGRFLQNWGPGLITGAADDDPSGISRYSVAGASYGYATLWTALLSFSLMAAIQLMCARLGMVTGCGLASVIRNRDSRWVLWFACALVVIANVFNIGADLRGMADGMQMITGVHAYPSQLDVNSPSNLHSPYRMDQRISRSPAESPWDETQLSR